MARCIDAARSAVIFVREAKPDGFRNSVHRWIDKSALDNLAEARGGTKTTPALEGEARALSKLGQDAPDHNADAALADALDKKPIFDTPRIV